MQPENTAMNDDDREMLRRWSATYADLRRELATAIVGCDEPLEQLFVALLARGHCLIEGVAGTAKSRMAEALARCLSFDFRRLGLTPESRPADVTGVEQAIEDHGGPRMIALQRGPLFANVVVADGISHARPKLQMLLLDAMRERHLEIGATRYELPEPFLLVATQNPSEPDAPHPLPAAQLDRFLLKIVLRYPAYEDEYRIAAGPPAALAHLRAVASAAEILALQSLVRRLPPPPPIMHYALRLVRTTRVYEGEEHDFILEWVSWGAGTRGVHALIEAATARALLHDRTVVTAADVRAVAHPVLRHRIVTNAHATSNGVTPDRVIDRLIVETPERVPGDELPPASAANNAV